MRAKISIIRGELKDRSFLVKAVKLVCFAGVYFLLARLGDYLASQYQGVPVTWFPSGIALSLLLLSRRRYWIPILLVFSIADIADSLLVGYSVFVCIGYAIADGIEAYVSARLLTHFISPEINFRSLKSIVGLVLYSALLTNCATGLLGAFIGAIGNGADFWAAWIVWIIADGTGIIVLTPIIVCWAREFPPHVNLPPIKQIVANLFYILAFVLISVLVFQSRVESGGFIVTIPYVPFLFLIAIALNMGIWGGSLGVVFLIGVALWSTVVDNKGPFSVTEGSIFEQVMAVQLYLNLAAVSSFISAAIIHEKDLSEKALRHEYALVSMVSGISTRFLNQLSRQFENNVKKTLEEIGRFLDIDYCFLEISDQEYVLKNRVLGWGRNSKLLAIPGNREPILDKPYRWLNDKLKKNELLKISSIFDLPVEANDEKQFWLEMGVKSTFLIPIFLDKTFIGLLGFYSTKEGKVWSDDDSKSMKLVGEIFLSVLARFRSEQALSDSERRFRTIYENAPIMLGVLDSRGKCLLWNQEMEKVLGLSRIDVADKEVVQSDVSIAGEEFFKKIRKETEGNKDIFKEFVIHAQDGSSRTQMWAYYALEDGTHIGIGVDITEQKRIEDALRQSESRYRELAIEIDRLLVQARQDAETKTELLNEVNHRVKNNLSAIIGLLYTEQRFTKGDDQESSRRILAGLTNRIEGLVLAHNLLSASYWRPIRLDYLVDQVLHSALKALPVDKTIGIDVESSQVLIQPKHANSLALIINELAANTLKFALADRKNSQISVNISQSDDRLEVKYQDEGPGYPLDVINQKRRNVGLYLLQTIVQYDLKGGFILENKQGAVTTIWFNNQIK